MKNKLLLFILGLLFVSTLCKTPCVAAWESMDSYSEIVEVVSLYSKSHPEVKKGLDQFLFHVSLSNTSGLISAEDNLRIFEAIKFSAMKHEQQTRKDPESTPYIIHPIGVADHLLVVGHVNDADILIGALLHDTVEDTETSFEEIRIAFGVTVENLVREVTDDKSLPKMERKALQILHAPEKSSGAAQIKLADKFYNLNDLLRAPPTDWEKERIDAYFDWAEKVVHALPPVNEALLKAVDQTISNYRSQKSLSSI